MADYERIMHKRPTVRLRVRCPLCDSVTYPEKLSIDVPVRADVYMHCYLGRGLIQQVKAKISKVMYAQLRAEVISKCLVILDLFDYDVKAVPQIVEHIEARFVTDCIVPRSVSWIE